MTAALSFIWQQNVARRSEADTHYMSVCLSVSLPDGRATFPCNLPLGSTVHYVYLFRIQICYIALWNSNPLTLSLLMSYIYGAPSKAKNLTSYIYGRDFYWGFFFLNRKFR
jgi:hypothetical protein